MADEANPPPSMSPAGRCDADAPSSPNPPLPSSNDLQEVEDEDQSRARPERLEGEWWYENRVIELERFRRTRQASGSAANGVGVATEEGWLNQAPRDFQNPEGEESVDEGQYGGDEPDSLLSRAKTIVQQCVRHCNENVNMSDLELEDLPDSIISPLKDMAQMIQCEGERAYVSPVLKIKLFLFGNRLQTIPISIFSVENMTVLSLRQNRLTEIPPAIGRLRNLQELDLRANMLTFLPFDILKLVTAGRLKILDVQLNPFKKGPPHGSTEAHLLISTRSSSAAVTSEHPTAASTGLTSWAWGPTRYAVSSVTFFHIDGSRHLVQPAFNSSNPGSEVRHRVPSLLELCLHVCYQSPRPSELTVILPADAPPNPVRALQQAEHVKRRGGETCSVCGKHYVRHRTEHIEWWYCIPPVIDLDLVRVRNVLDRPIAPSEPVPFLRRGCSWACGPNANQPARLLISTPVRASEPVQAPSASGGPEHHS